MFIDFWMYIYIIMIIIIIAIMIIIMIFFHIYIYIHMYRETFHLWHCSTIMFEPILCLCVQTAWLDRIWHGKKQTVFLACCIVSIFDVVCFYLWYCMVLSLFLFLSLLYVSYHWYIVCFITWIYMVNILCLSILTHNIFRNIFPSHPAQQFPWISDAISRERLYIHRIGRSGRFGRKGVAINFARPPSGAAVGVPWCGWLGLGSAGEKYGWGQLLKKPQKNELNSFKVNSWTIIN